MDEIKGKLTRFVAFGRDPGLHGEYEKRGITLFEVRRFCNNDGEGFWSLVRGEHAVLATMETIRTTVTLLSDKAVGDMDYAASFEGCQDRLPLPHCELEVWTRTS